MNLIPFQGRGFALTASARTQAVPRIRQPRTGSTGKGRVTTAVPPAPSVPRSIARARPPRRSGPQAVGPLHPLSGASSSNVAWNQTEGTIDSAKPGLSTANASPQSAPQRMINPRCLPPTSPAKRAVMFFRPAPECGFAISHAGSSQRGAFACPRRAPPPRFLVRERPAEATEF